MYHLDRRKNARGQAVVVLLAMLSFILAGAALGFWIGKFTDSTSFAANAVRDRSETSRIEPAPAVIVRPVTPDPRVKQEINAIAIHLEDMQAELMRLNALGARLVDMAELDTEEFDFEGPPPQGGPDGMPARDYTIKELASELSSVVDLIQDRQRKLDLIEDVITEKALTARSIPSGWPVASGYISSRYGFRIHPIKKTRAFHDGIDFASPRGTPIVAVADGVVNFSGWKRGYGRVVDIRHQNGLVTRYAHNNSNLVKVGQSVRRGQKIATVGSTGNSTGPHVHFEVRKDGKSINPARYLGSTSKPTLASQSMDFSG